jgi:hydroxymethylpyrimidine/phosphomethylpyrimidine kinase
MKTALTIAGSDSGAGAGIQADLKTFAAWGVYGTCAITAVTAQNTLGVTAVHPLPADIVTAQIEAVMADIGADSAKTGMLATAAIVEAVAAAAEALEIPLLVVDPVMVASSGESLLEPDGVAAMRSELLPRAFVVTPNAPEAALLANMPVRTLTDAREAARRIHAFGPHAVVVKGGHLPGDEVVDLLYDGREFVELTARRIPSDRTHGTGCTFSAALAAHLALGRSLHDAFSEAKRYVTKAIEAGLPIGRSHGPLDHFWMQRSMDK